MKTVKDYLKEVDVVSLVQKTVEMHVEQSWDKPDQDKIEELVEGYTSVYMRLISFGEWTWFRSKYKVSVRVNEGFPGDDEPYLDVSLLNKEYEEPPEDVKWWGGYHKIKDDAPEGHYNCNYSNYNKYFAIDFMAWRVTVNLELHIDETASEYSIEDILAEYLYEITFNGFHEKSYIGMKKSLKQTIAENDSIPYEDVMKELNDYAEDRTPVEPQGEDEPKIRFTKQALEDVKKMIDKSAESDNH